MSRSDEQDVSDKPLQLVSPAEQELESLGHSDRSDEDLAAQANQFVTDVLALAEQGQRSHGSRDAVDSMGIEVQQEASHRSAMLQEPIRRLAHQGDEGGPVANALLELRGAMDDLDPRRHTLSVSGLNRLLSLLPGIGSPLQRYFRKFETAQEALDAIIHDLQAGRDMLRRDNITLADDQDAMQRLQRQLDEQVRLGRLIDERLEKAASEAGESARQDFILEELLFPLRQRITDLQQQLAVTQQGVLALEVIIRNNRELMRGVDRAINVTVSALNVAVTVALALANQRLVLDRVERLNRTTSDMIAGTAEQLRSQGVDIQARAGSATLDMEKLEGAFENVMSAIDELGRYRREALPRLDQQIERLQALTNRGASALDRMERGNAAADASTPTPGGTQ